MYALFVIKNTLRTKNFFQVKILLFLKYKKLKHLFCDIKYTLLNL